MLASNIYALLMTGSLAAGYTVNNEKRGDDDIIIGYRSTNAREAQDINKENKLVWKAIFHQSEAQLGPGVYMSPILGEYNPGDKFDWFCVVKASRQGIEKINKAWIPEMNNNGEKQWFQRPLIEQYLKQFDEQSHRFGMEDTIRMSIIDRTDDKLQLVIPSEIITEVFQPDLAKMLGISAKCYEGKDNVPENERDAVIYANAPFSVGSVGDIA